MDCDCLQPLDNTKDAVSTHSTLADNTNLVESHIANVQLFDCGENTEHGVDDINSTSGQTDSHHVARRKVKHHDRLVPNVGSSARDFLANERTFLAWFRLGVNIFIIGILVCIDFKANINDFNVPYQHALADRIVGSIITLLSFLTMLMAMYRYAKVVALLACLREKLRGRTGLHWAYTVLASSIIMAAVLGLIRH